MHYQNWRIQSENFPIGPSSLKLSNDGAPSPERILHISCYDTQKTRVCLPSDRYSISEFIAKRKEILRFNF